MKLITPLLFVFFCCFNVFGQKILNARAEVDQGSDGKTDRVFIYYDLPPQQEGESYDIYVYASHDNFSQKLSSVTGDVGPNVIPGDKRRITWIPKNELGNFSGEIIFEIRGERTSTPIVVLKPYTKQKIKRGKKMEIVWQGGRKEEKINLELYKNRRQYREIELVENNGTYTWKVPKKLKPDNYDIKVSSAARPDNSELVRIKVKKRTSFFVKMLPVLAAGAAGYYFYSNQPEPDLPSPPGTP